MSSEETVGRRGRARRSGVSPAQYRRFLRQVGVGALIPGAGLISAGRKKLGWTILAVFVLLAAAAAVYAVRGGLSGLVDAGTDTDTLNLVTAGLAAVAVAWLVTALVSLYLLQPRGLKAPQRLLSALVVVVVASLVVSPLSIGSRYAYTQRGFIGNVFADDDSRSLTRPDSSDEDPWAGQQRVNVLILGSDAGPGREETRTDTVMVASINTETGDTALFSLPRNLLNLPMPPDTPLAEAYPEGWTGPEEDAYYWLSAVYRFVPHEFPEYFEGIPDPGAEAVKLIVGEALGLDIHYYVMVNLRGFQYLVDAFGGIDIDVPYRIPIGTKEQYGRCTEPSGWIEPGENQHLDGYRALWFARARCGPGPVSDDYERMRRQRCVIGAITEQADPMTVLRRYQQLASAAENTMSTDITQDRLSDFAELALKVQESGGLRSLPFTDDIIEYHNPDYDVIREYVQQSLDPPAETPPPSPENPDNADGPTSEATEPSADDPTEQPTDEPTDEPTEEAPDEEAPADEPTGDSETPGGTETPNEADGAVDVDDVC
ncbi:LytR family transcriptional regulator [Jiangella aurantiaca]|uniref:LytR family transcriptional regulator n=1 Tax=Jiangella aurantiaca TaxID=2530373 RepID=A0A4R5A7W4_9ACTN|nr:LCP family protein [Jiangella aurantiaca]TDD67745.1 LytR family transcriptional regulator [Jiangella aurantiaca]